MLLQLLLLFSSLTKVLTFPSTHDQQPQRQPTSLWILWSQQTQDLKGWLLRVSYLVCALSAEREEGVGCPLGPHAWDPPEVAPHAAPQQAWWEEQIARRAHRPGDEGECYQEPDPTGPGVPKSTRPGCLLSSLPRRLKRRRVVIVKLGCIRGRRGESDTTQTQTQGCWGPLVMSISNLVDGERHFEQR